MSSTMTRTPAVNTCVSPEEWETRVDLAAAYRLVALYGWDDLVFTHISARVPGPEHHFLINPYGMMFEEITASSLVKVDRDGRKVMDSPYEINPAGFTIHSCIHRAREDALCVVHVHSVNGVAVSAQKQGLLPISQQSLFILSTLGYHDYEGLHDPSARAGGRTRTDTDTANHRRGHPGRRHTGDPRLGRRARVARVVAQAGPCQPRFPRLRVAVSPRTDGRAFDGRRHCSEPADEAGFSLARRSVGIGPHRLPRRENALAGGRRHAGDVAGNGDQVKSQFDHLRGVDRRRVVYAGDQSSLGCLFEQRVVNRENLGLFSIESGNQSH